MPSAVIYVYGSQLSGHIMRGFNIMAIYYVISSGNSVFKFKTLKAARQRAKLLNTVSSNPNAFTIISRVVSN